ncbi:hypothetical protein OEZ85_002211 [Tetradesmus obliquus]|uniref:Uncharacterized protein n=1 Tax=Tetradesmus obliquus TaxID=3088 RepID=A0ABY8U2I0_TETOB|nr:hypothetical protein OEZ85_002211 [Tetradesmus obliquus]
MEMRRIVDGIKDPLTARGYRYIDAADYDTAVLSDQNEAFEKYTSYRDDICMTRSKSPMPSRSATPAPVKLKKESQALPSYGVYGADSGSQYEPSKEAADEDDAADAEMTELESQTPVHFHSLLYMFINDSQKLSFCHASAMPFCR